MITPVRNIYIGNKKQVNVGQQRNCGHITEPEISQKTLKRVQGDGFGVYGGNRHSEPVSESQVLQAKNNNQKFLPSFTGYLSNKPKVTLEYGVENNFFKLPKITFEDGTTRQIQPDKSQLECASKLCKGKNVAFFAPTGMGKTTVAHFAMGKNLHEGKKTVYTVPIKALANDKYKEFSKIYGRENVGILTGDRKINGSAPIVIMTTEIFDNQAQTMSLNEALKIGTVVYDEAHYIADEERGFAWEHSMINAASKGIQVLALTATAGNAKEFSSWIGKIQGARPSEIVEVPSENRPVPLVWHLYRPSSEYDNKLAPILIGEVDLSSDLEDYSGEIIDLIYKIEREYYEMRHENNKHKPEYKNRFLLDENYKTKVALKLEQALGSDWINADFESYEVYEKLKEEFISLGMMDLVQIQSIAKKSGVRSLSDNQKRALETIYESEYEDNANYEMTDDDYEFAYQQLKMGIGEGQNNFRFDTETFKKRLRREFRSLDETDLDMVTQLMSRPDVKTTRTLHEDWQEDDFPTLIRDLEKQDMLPAIIFKLSQGGCDAVANNLAGGYTADEEELTEEQLRKLEEETQKLDLLTPKEKEEVQKIIDKYEAQGVYLGTNPQKQMLLRGFGVHHAGKVPQYKKLVEELFSKKLMKVVVSTSTLGAGINMPAKTVVMTNTTYTEYNDVAKEYEPIPITANEFHQMTGRAGRRGIDKVGHVVLYNLHTPYKGFNKEGKDKNGKIDELWLAYELMKAPADDLRSTFRPQSVMLANYYAKNHDLSGIQKIIKQSFKMHLAKDKQKIEKQIFKKFENFTQVLQKTGCLIKHGKNEYFLTPKGEILAQAQGMNPLLVTSLLYDEKLGKMNPVQLAQVVGQIQGSDEQEESGELNYLVETTAKAIGNAYNFNSMQFELTKYALQDTEDKILRALNEGRVNKIEIKHTDTFSGFAVSLFASLNEANPDDSIKNFEKVVNSSIYNYTQDREAQTDFERRCREGNIYKIIAGSISTLKQMIRICDYAINSPSDYPNTAYWETVKENAQKALELLDKEPINNDPDYANKSSNI